MKMPHVASAFVPAVLLGESEPKGVAEASQKAAEQVVSMHPLLSSYYILIWCMM